MVDRSAIGRNFTPVTAHVEPGRLRYFCDTIGENNPIYRDAQAARAEGYAAIPVPPTYLFCLEMMDAENPFEFLTELDIDLARVLHGEQGFTYHVPAVVGDTLTFRSRVTDVTEKKGGAMTLIAVVTDVTRQDGVHLAGMTRTVVVRNPKAAST
ncbi:MAG: MaoC family dehydratase N-terminal domain-containing protein [Xanthobacteraceae bacterium]|nr:MaoC family dehydratase N-terminal domain-containing protein [Xanthobacteraceae bacterium]